VNAHTRACPQAWPWFARLAVLTHYRGIAIPTEPRFEALHRWIAAVRARPAVAATQMPDEYYVGFYKAYADGSRVPK
jgi:glutathione S-transferase